MKFRPVVRPMAAVLGAVLCTNLAWAQAQPPKTAQLHGPAVLSDLDPPPAEERSSTGAIVLDNSRVRAQRGFARMQRDPTTVMGNVAAPADKALRAAPVPAKAPARPQEK